MSITSEQLFSLQTSYCLQSCKHQGGLLWIRDWDLRLGIIVGQDDSGTMWMVVDQPSKMHYQIQALSSMHSSDYYIDFDNPQIDKEATAILAFDLLKKYNAFNGQKYDSFHKVDLPEILEGSRPNWKEAFKAQLNDFTNNLVEQSVGRISILNQRIQQLLAPQVVAVEASTIVSESKSIELSSKENIHRQTA